MKKTITVKVLGKPVSIKWYSRDILGDNVGLANGTAQRISIADDLPKEEEQDTMLHEIIHVIDHMMDMDLQESQVHRLATGLLAFFKDNPKYYDRWIR